MVDFMLVAATKTTMHFGAPELLAIVAGLFMGRWAWTARHDPPRIAGALRRRSLPGPQQETVGQLPAPALPPTAAPGLERRP